MRIVHLVSALALSIGIMGVPAYAAGAVTGDYLEARSCNVFVGGCHYGAEFVTNGREAVMAWHVARGGRGGVNLAGLSAAAVVSADLNLAESQAKRSAILYVDASATPSQREALVGLLKEKCSDAFGTVVDVRTAPIRFAKSDTGYQLQVGGDARLSVAKEVDRSCCLQPMDVWYKPLAPVAGSAVGFASLNEFKGSGLPTTWSRSNQNSAFYGNFTF
jgi:hypothetical protein